MVPTLYFTSLSRFLPGLNLKTLTGFSLAVTLMTTTGFQSHAASTGKSGLPLPRFVSLKSKRVNMRVGPGREYQVAWMYQKPGLPMEIIQEYDNWRKVRDPEGNEGWILHSLLTGKRTAIIAPWDRAQSGKNVEMLSSPDASASVKAEMEPGVVASVQECTDSWCRIEVSGVAGIVNKNDIWGVYPDEIIER